MNVSFKVGSVGGGRAYVDYLLKKAVEIIQPMDAAARYYAEQPRQPEPAQPLDDIGRAVFEGEVTFSAALADLIGAEMRLHPPQSEAEISALEERLGEALKQAASRAEFLGNIQATGGNMAAQLRPDMDAKLAERLGIDPARPLTVREFGNLLSNKRTDGGEIAGKHKHSAHRSVAEIFGLDPKALPGVTEIDNVLDGRRADGAAPVDEAGKLLHARIVASSLRQFKTAIGIKPDLEATPDDIAKVSAAGFDAYEYYKRINRTSPPVGYIDVQFGVEKGFTIAYALAPTEGEAALIRSLTERATAVGMGYMEQRLGWARTGAGGQGAPERAVMGWASVEHFNSRPAVDVIRYDAGGQPYTDTREVPGGGIADPHLHRHNVVFSSMLTESGRIASVNLDLLDGEVKTIGAVSSAALATFAREQGMDVVLGKHGEARLAAIPDWLRDFYSRRTTQGTDAARDYAKERGKDWDKLTDNERIALIKGGAAATRQDKQRREADEEGADRAVWRGEAEAAGYRHRSVLRPDHIEPKLTGEQRIETARMAALPLIDEAFAKRAVIPLNDLRELAARGLVVSGIGADAAADVAAVVKALRERGVVIDGEQTQLVFGTELDAKGRERTVVTNDKTIADERELLDRVKMAAADRSAALTPADIDVAAERFLAKHPKIDRNGEQWKSQLAMAHAVGEGGRTSLSVGVAGSGKTSSVVAVLTDAWHAEGKTVYGMTVPWRATQPLKDAGVDQALAIDAFLKREADGKITVDRNMVIVADEVSMISVRQQLALLRLADRTGAQLVEIGDPKQCASCETPSIDLMAKAIGDEAIPKLLTTIRQETEREREIATLFRDGRAVEGVRAMLDADRLHLVAGGDQAAIADTVARWRVKRDANAADPDYSLHVVTGTNARTLDIGKAIREDRRVHGEIGRDAIVLQARDPNSKATYDLPLAIGDKIRVFNRIFDADTPWRGRQAIASNGDVLDIRAVLADGLRVCNQDGVEARVEWKGFKAWRAPANDPVQLTYGYAATVDATQALTKTDVLVCSPDGTGAMDLRKGYTALSRHTRSVEMFVSDAAERRAIVARQRITEPGRVEVPSREDVIRNIAANLGRFEERRHATEMLAKAIEIQRGITSRLHRGAAAVEQAAQQSGVSDYRQARVAEVVRQVAETAERVRQAMPTLVEQVAAAGGGPLQTAATARSALPQPRVVQISEIEAQQQFADELRAHGLLLKGLPIMDGQIHHVAVEGNRGSEKSGSYKGFYGDDRPPAGAIWNHKQGGWVGNWKAIGNSVAVTPEEMAERAARAAEKAEQQRLDRIAREAAGAVRAGYMIASAKLEGPEMLAGLSATAGGPPLEYIPHSYLTAKGVDAVGLYRDNQGDLLIPLRNIDGEIRNVQTIDAAGTKLYLTGAQKMGTFHLIGDLCPGEPVAIAEGYATAASVHRATGMTVAMALDTSNLLPVATALRQQDPERVIWLAADNDHHLPRRDPPLPNTGREKAEKAAAAIGGKMLLCPESPERAAIGKGTDWNDYEMVCGRQATEAALKAGMREATQQHDGQDIWQKTAAAGQNRQPQEREQIREKDQGYEMER